MKKELTTTEMLEKDCKEYVKELVRLFNLKNREKFNDYVAGESTLDFEYRVNARREYNSVLVTLSCGGPNIYLDTEDAYIRGYWGAAFVEMPIPYDIRNAIDDIYGDMWECGA